MIAIKQVFQTCRVYRCDHAQSWDISLPSAFALKMETMCCSETSVDFQLSARRYIPEGDPEAEVPFGHVGT
jgi:hypothetical protein